MRTHDWLATVYAALILGSAQTSMASEDQQRGAVYFRQCIACHSVEPNEHLTGPSLAGVMNRKAGTAEGFNRYSPAMKQMKFEWTEETLDQWLDSPEGFIPGTSMRVPGIADPAARKELIAYLKVVTTTRDASASGQETGGTGPRRLSDLKQQSPSQQVRALRYCGDAYHVTLGSGAEIVFWEFNLRLKTDSSVNGPPKGQPAILRAGMRGDRASIIFAAPEEISEFIKPAC